MQSISSFLDLSGGADKINVIVLFVSHVIIVLKVHRKTNEARRRESALGHSPNSRK